MTETTTTLPDEVAVARGRAPWLRTVVLIAASLVPLALLVYAIGAFVFASDPMAGT